MSGRALKKACSVCSSVLVIALVVLCGARADTAAPDTSRALVVAAAVPHIDTVSPGQGPVGTEITIDGTSFGAAMGASYARFGTVHASTYALWSDTQVKCLVPAGAAGNVSLSITTTAGGTSNMVAFNVANAAGEWFLAEGTTDWGFDCYITVANGDSSVTEAGVTYMTDTGVIPGPTLYLPAESQTTLNPRDTLGNRDFSTRVACVDATKNIAVDRTMSWVGHGAISPEAHNSIGVTAPAQVWYLPEGSSDWGFECWLLIQNPNAQAANCAVTYMIEGVGPRLVHKQVPANSRRTFNMADDIGAEDASIMVQSDVPVIPERSMYRYSRREGHDSIGTTAPATDYYLAEGTTSYGFTTFVLIQNPNATPTDVTVTYMTPAGPRLQPTFSMPANSRQTIRVNDVVPGKDLSTWVHGSQPIIAERAMYWDSGKGEACHDSIGMSAPHRTFWLPDGQSSHGRETWTLVQNPNSTEVPVTLTYMREGGGERKIINATVPANSRRTFSMGQEYSGRASIKVSSDSASLIMVERSMYWEGRGAGTVSIGGFGD